MRECVGGAGERTVSLLARRPWEDDDPVLTLRMRDVQVAKTAACGAYIRGMFQPIPNDFAVDWWCADVLV